MYMCMCVCVCLFVTLDLANTDGSVEWEGIGGGGLV